MTAYWQLLKDPRWQRKRLEIMARDKWRCRKCYNKDKSLNVHHGYYEKGRMPWEYPDQSLSTLCEDCHEHITLLRRKLFAAIGILDPLGMDWELRKLYGFVCAGLLNDKRADTCDIDNGPELIGALLRLQYGPEIDRQQLAAAYLRTLDDHSQSAPITYDDLLSLTQLSEEQHAEFSSRHDEWIRQAELEGEQIMQDSLKE